MKTCLENGYLDFLLHGVKTDMTIPGKIKKERCVLFKHR